MNRVLIIGAGTVGIGTAVLLDLANPELEFIFADTDHNQITACFTRPGHNHFQRQHVQSIYDKATRTTQPDLLDWRAIDAVFICLPTPENNPETDLKVIDDYVMQALEEGVQHVVVRSTLRPNMKFAAGHVRSDQVIYMPEFLREWCYLTDAMQTEELIIGCDDFETAKMFVSDFAFLTDVKFKACSRREAILTKLMRNAYMAQRIAFFHEMHEFAGELGVDGKRIAELVTDDSRIGKGYCNQTFGIGGSCLPKDTELLRHHAMPYQLLSHINFSMVMSTTRNVSRFMNELELEGKKVGFIPSDKVFNSHHAVWNFIPAEPKFTPMVQTAQFEHEYSADRKLIMQEADIIIHDGAVVLQSETKAEIVDIRKLMIKEANDFTLN